MKPVIAFYGEALAGKDSAAKFLAKYRGVGMVYFARPLKIMVCDQFGWDIERMDDYDYKEEIPRLPDGSPQCPGPDGEGMTRREVLQWIGTNGFRHCAPLHWVRKGCEKLDQVLAQSGTQGAAICDTRFPNEFEVLRERYGALVVRVEKIGGPGTKSKGHESEQAWRDIVPDMIIRAEHGDLGFLRSQADDAWTVAYTERP